MGLAQTTVKEGDFADVAGFDSVDSAGAREATYRGVQLDGLVEVWQLTRRQVERRSRVESVALQAAARERRFLLD